MRVKNILIILLIFLVCISSANAFITFKTNAGVKISGYEIMLTGVTEDKSCIFKINNKTLSVPEHEEGAIEWVYIWVKDAFRTHSMDKDYCVVFLSLPSSLLNTTQTKKADDKLNLTTTIKSNITSTTPQNISEINYSLPSEKSEPIKEVIKQPEKTEEKGILKKIAGWFRELFW